MTWWAPGYPLLLALVAVLTKRTGLEAAALVQPAAFVIGMLSTAALLRRCLPRAHWLLIGAGLLFVAGPYVEVSKRVWSEMLFIDLVLGWLLALLAYQARGGWRWLAVVTLLGTAAMLTRFAGLELAPVGALALMLTRKPGRWWHALTLGSVSLAALGGWLARNYALSGTLTGPRFPSEFGLGQNIIAAVSTAAYWFAPLPLSPRRAALLLALALASALAVLWLRRRAALLARLRAVAPLLLFAVAYSAFIVVSATAIAYDPINTRLMAPVAPAVAVLVGVLMCEGLAAYPSNLPSVRSKSRPLGMV